jgi:hypothetical protein
MTKKAFLSWLAQHCSVEPVLGFNTTGDSQKITHNGRYKYLQGPFGDIELDDIFIIELCDHLVLGKYPPGITASNKAVISTRSIKSTLHKGTRGIPRKRRPRK